MSHVEQVNIVVPRDFDALARAAAACGGELIVGQRTHAWWGRWVGDYSRPESAVAQGADPKTFGTCDHAIRILGQVGVNGTDGPWEVGIRETPEGFKLFYDNYGRAGKALEAKFGKDLELLTNHLLAEVAINELSVDGWRYEKHIGEDGSIELELELDA